MHLITNKNRARLALLAALCIRAIPPNSVNTVVAQQPQQFEIDADGGITTPTTPVASAKPMEKKPVREDLEEDLLVWSFWPPLPYEQYHLTGRLRAQQLLHLDPKWYKKGAVVEPFDFDEGLSPSTHPLAYGRILASFTDIDPNSKTVKSALDYAFSTIDEDLGSSDGEDEPQDVAMVLRARKLDLDLLEDTAQCETLLLEMQYRGSDKKPKSFWYRPRTGIILYLEVSWRDKIHRLAISLDHDQQYAMMQHTWTSNTPDFNLPGFCPSTSPTEQQPPSTPHPTPLRVMTYNLWNTNPPSYLYPDIEERWSRYTKRIQHLAQVIDEAQADIIGLQEVRYDWQMGGAQIHHVLSGDKPPYQYVYQPAMTFAEGASTMTTQPTRRDEEGLAILSRYPIVKWDYLLLPRNMFDPVMDGHQRICLHATIMVPSFGLVDVYVSHFSLSERSRDRSVSNIHQWIQSQAQGRVQILMGDFNAEPHERSIQFLTGDSQISGHTGDFRDVWLDFYHEPPPNSSSDWDRQHALTFPCCNPVKRIDYILYRSSTSVSSSNSSSSGPTASARPKSVRLVGQEATPDTANQVSVGGGMLDHDSPIWASDHRAVVADFDLILLPPPEEEAPIPKQGMRRLPE